MYNSVMCVKRLFVFTITSGVILLSHHMYIYVLSFHGNCSLPVSLFSLRNAYYILRWVDNEEQRAKCSENCVKMCRRANINLTNLYLPPSLFKNYFNFQTLYAKCPRNDKIKISRVSLFRLEHEL